MRILVVGQNFYPELIGIGKYSSEMVEFLSESGLDVRVITAPPYYPFWRIQDGYNSWQYRRETWRGVSVFRAPLWVPARPTGMRRLVHLLSFALSSFPVILMQLGWRPNIIFCTAPNFMNAPFALFVSRLCGAKLWIHIQDFELDAAFGLGMLPGEKWLRPLAAAFESAILSRAAHVSTISENMVKRALEKGVKREHLSLLPNWVDTLKITPLTGKNHLRDKLGISDEACVVLYHGNMGYKQGLEVLIDAAKIFQDNPKIIFVLCGAGAARQELEIRALGLRNVYFLGMQPVERLNDLVNLADIHVLPQLSSAADLVMPSKLGSMLASGRAVIAGANPGTQVWNVVKLTGCVIAPENVPQLVMAIMKLSTNPLERERLGMLGRQYIEHHLSREIILFALLEAIQAMRAGTIK